MFFKNFLHLIRAHNLCIALLCVFISTWLLDKPIDFNSEINYFELDRKTLNLARNILNLGLSKGDAVALILPNSVEWVVAFLGTLRAGLTIVPISFDSTTEEINYKLQDSNTKFIITSTTNQKILESLKSFPNLEKFTCFTGNSVESNNLSSASIINLSMPIAHPIEGVSGPPS